MVVVHGSSPSDDSDSEDNELQVMLKKITGICLVIQLRSIQLYEADFNFYNQYVYRQEVMKALMDGGFLSEEHYSQKVSTAEYAKIDKLSPLISQDNLETQ